MKRLLLAILLLFAFASNGWGATFTQTTDIDLISLRQVAQGDSVIGTPYNVDGKLYGHVYIYCSAVSASNPTFGSEIEIQTCYSSGGNQWDTEWLQTTNAAASATEPIAVNTSNNVFSVSSSAGFAPPGWLYAQSTTTIGSGEFFKIMNVDTTGPTYITVSDNVAWTKKTADIIWEADVFRRVRVDFGGVKRLRVLFSNFIMSLGNKQHIRAKLVAVTAIE